MLRLTLFVLYFTLVYVNFGLLTPIIDYRNYYRNIEKKLCKELDRCGNESQKLEFLYDRAINAEVELQNERLRAERELQNERFRAERELQNERLQAKRLQSDLTEYIKKMTILEIDKNSSSIILRQILIQLAVRNKATIIENRHLDMKGIIPDGENRLDHVLPILQRKYKWFEMLNRRRSTDMYIQRLDKCLFKKYEQSIEDLQNTLVKENCDKLQSDLNERLKEMKVLNDSIKKKREGPNGSTTPNDLKEMENQLKVKKGDYKELEKNLKDKCMKVKDTIENLTYDEFKLKFCHSLAYSIENTNKTIALIEIMGLGAVEILKTFDGVINEYVSIFYNAVC